MPTGQLAAPRRASLSVAKMENTLLAAESGGVGFELEIIHSQTKRLVQRRWVKYLVRICSLLSLVSVCANTPRTYQLSMDRLNINGFGLREVLFAIDALVALVLTAEMAAKWRMKGVFRGESSYFMSRWCRFDFSMMLCLYASLVVHVFEISNRLDAYSFWSVVRAPRPLILVRLLRSALKFRLPRSRIQAILQRSSQQVFSVTIFLLFFMSLYGLLGVQFFGEMTHHCVRRGANRSAITKADLAIPDTYCSPTANRQRVASNQSETESEIASVDPLGTASTPLALLLTTEGQVHSLFGLLDAHNEEADKEGHSCPQNMECIPLDKDRHGFAGFDDFLISFFTVYQAASQEGWVFNMYRAMDSLQSWKALAYFISLIFFLAWLVKNVFIAVLIETFAEIRVQFQQMWVTPRAVTLDDSQKLTLAVDADARWRLVQLDSSRPEGVAPAWAQKFVRSSAFHVSVYILLVANAVTAASRNFDPLALPTDSPPWWADGWYLAEIGYTALFDLEALFKVWCFGRAAYWKRTLHRFETILCVFTSLHCIWPWYRSYLTYFQVLRIVRLIKASPMLEDFCFKIFGPVKKLGSLVIFTLCLLIITSTISLQLFCCINGLEKFATFPTAFRSMFQILTQKGWIDVMSDSMDKAMDFAQPLVPLVAIYFVFYHLFVTLIVLSLFVAVILDNLELDEDLKKLKQLKMREMSAETQQKLPLRLRIFEKFPNRPQMIRLNRVPSDFNVPKVRESFFRQFVNQGYDPLTNLTQVAGGVVGMGNSGQPNHVAAGAEALRQKPSVGTSRHSIVAMRNRSIAYGQRSRRVRDDAFQNAASAMLNHTGLRENHLATLAIPRDPKHIFIKMSALNDILRECNLQRLFVNNPQQLQRDQWHQGSVSGSKSLLSQQHRIRLDRRMHNTESAANSEGDKDGAGSKSSGAKSSTANAANDAAHDFDISLIQQKAKQAEMARTQLEEDLRENHPYFDTPLFAVGRDSRIRKFCLAVVNARYAPPESGNQKYKGFQKLLGSITYLDWFMIIVNLFSIISMLCETPQLRVAAFLESKNQPYYEKNILRLTFIFVMEYIFVTCMTLEMLMKILANGLIFTPNAVLKDAAGFLVLFTYIVAVVFAIWLPSNVSQMSAAHVLMLCRCMRPLRFFCLVPQMRQVVYELLRGFREILMVSVLLVVFMFMFASFGVQNFGGRLARCNDVNCTRENCTGLFRRKIFVTKLKLGGSDEEAPSFLVHRVWANPKNFNFDNIGNAMLALFEVLSLEGWIEVRDILENRIGPLHAIIYIHVFVFIGCMIGLTLFVGVVITNYSQNRGTSLLTVDQRRWLDLKARIKLTQPLHTPPRPDHQIWRANIYDFVQSQKCKRCIGCLILANSLLLIVPWYDSERNDPNAADPALTRYLAYASVAFNLLFFAEAVLKIIALNINGYFQSLRNRFDFVISVSGMLFNVLLLFARNKATYTVGWCVIVVRFFTITGKYARLKMLLLTVLTSILKSFFIILSMIVLMLCYAFNGVLLFGSVKYGENLGRHAHFKSAPQAMALLCRIVTGEDWNKIAHDCMIQPPFCTVKANFWETNCGNFYAATLYFCSYYIIITYIMLNLLVAIIMENFTLFYSSDEDVLLSYNDIRQFQQTWDIVDINRKGAVPIRRIKILLLLLKGRLEVDIERDKWLFKHMYFELEKVHNGGDVSYHDVLYMLSYRSVDIRKSLQFDELMQREQLEYMIEEEVAKQTIRVWLDKCLRRRRKVHEKSNMYASLRAQSSDLVVTVTEIASLNNPFQVNTSGAISPQGHLPAGGLSANFMGVPELSGVDQKSENIRGVLNGMTSASVVPEGNEERAVSFGTSQRERERERDASPSASSTCSASQQDSGSALQSAGLSTKDVEFSYPSVPSLPTTTSGSCSTLTPARGLTGTPSDEQDKQDSQATPLADNLAASRIARRRIERNTSLPVMLASGAKGSLDGGQRDSDGGTTNAAADTIPEENADGYLSSSSLSESRTGTFKRRSQKAGAPALPGLHESETEVLGKDGSTSSDGTSRLGVDFRTSNYLGENTRTIDDEVCVTPKAKTSTGGTGNSNGNDEANRSSLALVIGKEDNVSDHGSFSNEIQSQCLFMSAEKTQTAFVAAQHVKTWWSQLLGGTPSASPIASRTEPVAAHKYSYDRVKLRGRAVRMATTYDSDSDA